MNTNELYQQTRKIAEGHLKCLPCGNLNWDNFLFIQNGDSVVAGCKQCGRIYTYATSTKVWGCIGGPVEGR